MGIAYGFFTCKEPKERITEALPEVRMLAELPANIDILVEGIRDWGTDDSRLREIIEQETAAGMQYLMQVRRFTASNAQAAYDTVDILNHLMYRRQLYAESDPFNSDVIFEERGRFVSYDEGF